MYKQLNSIQEKIYFHGHKLISAKHSTTIEITKDQFLTKNGDCIVGIKSEKGCQEIKKELKNIIRNNNSIIKIEIIVQEHKFTILGQGSSELSLTHVNDIVIRKSEYICPRTLAIKCNKSSIDIPREMINLLKNNDAEGVLIITAWKN